MAIKFSIPILSFTYISPGRKSKSSFLNSHVFSIFLDITIEIVLFVYFKYDDSTPLILEDLENIDDDILSKKEKLDNISECIKDILSHIDDYRKIANKDGNGKIYRLD